jgi:hypothetical protein
MTDGAEYASLLGVQAGGLDLASEIRRGVAEIETARQRPLILYVANTIKPVTGVNAGIVLADDVPFAEMVQSIPPAVSLSKCTNLFSGLGHASTTLRSSSRICA